MYFVCLGVIKSNKTIKIMKSKVIKVDYRKESESFPDWMKYEITLLNEDGSEELIPAYGKDLQHALSRVVKSRKVEKVRKIPLEVWVAAVLLYMTAISIPATETKNPLWVVGGLVGLFAIVLGYRYWLTRKK